MKRSITLGHADVVIAISAYLVEQGMGEVNEVNFHLDSEGQVTAVAIESEAKASTGRASRATPKDAVAEEEKPAGRSRRGTKTEDADDKAEDAEATTSTCSRRGSRSNAEAEDKPASTGRASRGSRKPAAPTVPEKSEDDYNVDSGETDENVTYWVNLDDESEVFAVPAGQELPDSEQYEEIGSEAEALERIAANGDNAEEAQAEEEEAPATTGRTRRTRGAASEEKAEPATTGRTRRGAAAAQDTAPAETTARRPRLLRKS